MVMMLHSLRRFGPAYCDLPTMVNNIGFLLRLCIVNIESKYTRRIPTIFYVIQILSGALYFYVFQICMVWFVFIRCRETKDSIAASVVFSLATCSMPGISKLIYIRLNIERIKNLIDEYLECDASIDSSTRFYTNLLQALYNVKWRAAGLWLFIIINGILYFAVAIGRPGRHFVEDLYVIYGLEPMFESPNYEIAFFMMTAGMYFGIPAELNTTTLLTILVGYIESQMLALSKELENIWQDANASYQLTKDWANDGNNNENLILNELIRKLLKDILFKHIIIIDLLGQVENVFRNAIAIQLGILTLGLISELLGGLENTYMQVPYTMIQLTMDCFIGQKLIDASLGLSYSVYNCKWERFDKLNQRIVYVMLMNSQKTLSLSVGGLTVLSFSYLMSVLNSIYSAYTALRNRI